MKTCLSVMIWLLLCMPAYAQHCLLQGHITGSGRPLEGVMVTLLAAGQKQRIAAFTDSTGYFCFSQAAAGSYHIRIQSVGYRTYETSVVLKDAPVYLGVISLQIMDSVLEGVVISAAALPVVQKHDTTEYAADAYKLAENASAATLLRKLPGILVQGGNIKAQGEQVVNILVDGKPFFTGDPYAALSVLPAGMVERVQLYRNKQADGQISGFSDKPAPPVINLVIKQNRKHSVFGNVYAGAGSSSRYLSGVTASTFSGDRRASAILEANNVHAVHYTADQLPGTADNTLLDAQQASCSYTDKWKNLELAATYGYLKNTASQETQQERHYTQLTDSGAVYHGADKRISKTEGHNLSMTLDYRPDSQNSLQLQPQWAVQQNLTSADITGIMLRQGTASGAATDNNVDITTSSFGTDALYVHKWCRSGCSLILGAGYRHNESRSGLMQTVRDGITPADSMYLQTGLRVRENILTANAAYAIPLGKAGELQVQYDMNRRDASSGKYNYSSPDPVQPGTMTLTTVFNQFSTAAFTQKAGVFYRLRKNRTDVSAGLFGQLSAQQLRQQQPSVSDAGKTYRNLLPVLSAQYYFTPAKNLQLMYMPDAALPEILQLQPVADNANPMLLYMGNPMLKQVYQHNISMRYSALNAARRINYFLLLSGSYAYNYIGNSIFFAEKDTLLSPGVWMREGAQLQQPVNAGNYTYLNLTAGYGFPLWKLHVDADITGNLVRVPVAVNGTTSLVRRQGIGADVSVSSNISNNVDLTCSSNNTFSFVAAASGSSLYYMNNSNLLLNLILPAGFTVSTGIAYRLTKAPGAGNGEDALLCSLGIGKQLWKERAQLRALVYDCTGRNKNISQFVTDTYTEQLRRNAMQRYIMLVFNYNFRKYR